MRNTIGTFQTSNNQKELKVFLFSTQEFIFFLINTNERVAVFITKILEELISDHEFDQCIFTHSICIIYQIS